MTQTKPNQTLTHVLAKKLLERRKSSSRRALEGQKQCCFSLDLTPRAAINVILNQNVM